MKEYDRAAHNFYSGQQINSLPLEAWDLFSMRYGKLCSALTEIRALKLLAAQHKWKTISFIESEILQKNHIIVVTDPNLTIVHASDNIYDMNGYRPKEIIGKKPKMFQGEKTCIETTQKIRNAIDRQESFKAVIVNYRKDGSSYNCWINGYPIKDKKGKVVNFIAFEKEVA